MNAPETTIIQIPGLMSKSIRKKIIFEREGLRIQKNNSFDPPTFIAAENIAGFRFGLNWFYGFQFTVGRQYIIQIIDSQNNIFTIKLNSYYQLKQKTYHKIWLEIINQLWDNFFVNNFNYYFDLYTIKQEFDLGDIKFHPFGISWPNVSLFWDEIAISNYQTYFTIHHRGQPMKNKHCNFKNDWNALILQSLLKKIIQEQNAFRNPAF